MSQSAMFHDPPSRAILGPDLQPLGAIGPSWTNCPVRGARLPPRDGDLGVEPEVSTSRGKSSGWWLSPTPLKNVKVNWNDGIPK